MYDKKIAYLHYIKNGELVGNAGHVKVTQRGNNFNIEVYVREVYGILNGCYYIENLGGNPFENKINIEEGQAVYKKRIEINKNDEEALPYGLKIETGKEEYLEAVWRAREKEEKKYGGKNWTVEEKAYEERAGQEQVEQERIGQEREGKKKQNTEQKESTVDYSGQGKEIWTDTWSSEERFAGMELPEQKQTTQQGRETEQGEINPRENIQRGAGFYKQQSSDVQVAEKEGNRQEGGTWKNLTFSVPVETYEDKWNELCKKYEVIHPFGNREEYLSLSPKDFIIFPEKYQHLVNNSFLLHGYYNYRHIILGKKEEGGKNIYYLGVPGVYYEREKMVAIMFGFEGFECGEKRAIAGGFGYYMRRIEL